LAKGHDFSRAENDGPKIDFFGDFGYGTNKLVPFLPWPMSASGVPKNRPVSVFEGFSP